MQTRQRNLLVIAPDPGVSEAVEQAVAGDAAIRLRAEPGTLSGLNGQAVRIAAGQDMILVQTDPTNPAELAAIAALSGARDAGTVIVALADASISLAQVRALTGAGVDEVLPLSGAMATLGADIARLGQAPGMRRLRLSVPAAPQGRLIAVAAARGGIGATTLSVNLADQLTGRKGWGRKRTPHRVALLDLDLQFGAAGSMLDLPEQEMLARIAQDGTVPDANFLEQSMTALPSGLSVLAAPSKFVPLDALSVAQVAAMLDALRETYEYVIVDLPHALVGWIEPVVQRADAMILVTDTAVPSVRQCRRLIDFFTADNLALPVQVVASHEKRATFGSGAQREAARALERKIDHWLPWDPRHARAAVDQGRPLSAQGGPLCRAITRLARSIEATYPATAPSPAAN